MGGRGGVMGGRWDEWERGVYLCLDAGHHIIDVGCGGRGCWDLRETTPLRSIPLRYVTHSKVYFVYT